jgi:hypothetical protein
MACGAYGEEGRSCRILLHILKERNYLDDLGIDGRMLLKWVLRWKSVDWINLAEDRANRGVFST